MNDPVADMSGSAGTVTFPYYIDPDCNNKATDENSGAESECAAPKNAGDYWVKATLAEDGSYGSATSSNSARWPLAATSS